jgi:hypothetical protein
MEQRDVLPYFSGLADDYAHAVVNEEVPVPA